jgi:hypothetical protein
MLAGRAAGPSAGTCSAAAGRSVSGEPRWGVGAALTDTGAGPDGVVDGVLVGGAGSDCWSADAGSTLGPTVSLPVVVTITVLCSGVGCAAGSGSALGRIELTELTELTELDGGCGSVSFGGVSTGGVVLTGGGIGRGVGVATCVPLTIIVLSPVVGCCCSVEEACSFAQASLELRTTKAKRHKTSAITRARGLRSCRWALMAVLLCGCPRVKSLRTLPIVPR